MQAFPTDTNVGTIPSVARIGSAWEALTTIYVVAIKLHAPTFAVAQPFVRLARVRGTDAL